MLLIIWTANLYLHILGTIEILFSDIGLPIESIPTALKAMERDSQNGLLAQRGHFQIEDSLWRELEEILTEVGAPVNTKMTPEEFRVLIKGR